MEEKPTKTIYLWTLPRSLSTAFLRAMSTVQGCKVRNYFFTPYPQPSDFMVTANNRVFCPEN